MLNENDIVSIVAEYLSKKGYSVEKTCTTSDQGVDILARHVSTGNRLLVEAKGETSSKPRSARYGLPFNNSQVRTHVSEAVLTTLEVLSSAGFSVKTVAAIALPKTALHERHISAVKPALDKMRVKLFWVTKNGVIES